MNDNKNNNRHDANHNKTIERKAKSSRDRKKENRNPK